jgi:hypothetical protein
MGFDASLEESCETALLEEGRGPFSRKCLLMYAGLCCNGVQYARFDDMSGKPYLIQFEPRTLIENQVP